MISDDAYNKLKDEVQSRKLSEGVLAESLHLYLKDFQSTQSENPEMQDNEIQSLLLRPTGVKSLINVATDNYKDGAVLATQNHRFLVGWISFGSNILVGVIANIIFTLVMIAFFLSARDVSENFFRALGFQINREISQNEPPAKPIPSLPNKSGEKPSELIAPSE